MTTASESIYCYNYFRGVDKKSFLEDCSKNMIQVIYRRHEYLTLHTVKVLILWLKGPDD